MKIIERYKLNKESKVNDTCICPSCNSVFSKKNYQQAFCKTKGGTKCKDKYWNTVKPEKRNNTTRISPASARYMQRQAINRGFPDLETMKNHIDEDDGSWDAHQCQTEPCEYCELRAEYCMCE